MCYGRRDIIIQDKVEMKGGIKTKCVLERCVYVNLIV